MRDKQRRFNPTALSDRARFVRLWMGGMSFRGIAEATSTSVSTVYRWIHRWQREGHVNTKHQKQKHHDKRNILQDRIAIPAMTTQHQRTRNKYNGNTDVPVGPLGLAPEYFQEKTNIGSESYSEYLKLLSIFQDIRSVCKDGASDPEFYRYCERSLSQRGNIYSSAK